MARDRGGSISLTRWRDLDRELAESISRSVDINLAIAEAGRGPRGGLHAVATPTREVGDLERTS